MSETLSVGQHWHSYKKVPERTVTLVWCKTFSFLSEWSIKIIHQTKRGGRVRRTVSRISCMRRQKTNGLRAELKKRREQKALLRV